MAESTPNPTPKTRKKKSQKAPITRLSKYGDFEDEIVTLIVKPRIDHLLKQGVTSVNDLTQKFREAFDSGVSIETMKEWLAHLGYQLEKPKVTLVVQGPASPSSPSLHTNPAFRENGMVAQTPSSPAANLPDDPDVQFDNERTQVAAPPGATVATLRVLEAQGQVIDQPFRAVPSI